jgi:PGF-pre-PGF domain-containing protein
MKIQTKIVNTSIGILLCLLCLSINVSAQATVIMTFDDGWKSVADTALVTMKNNNQAGVAFIYPAAIIPGTWTDYMNIQQLNELTYAGWDISSHSYSHVNLTTTTNLTTELTSSKTWLDTTGYRGGSILAYPEGAYNPTVISATKAAGYQAARSTNSYQNILNITGFPTYALSGPDANITAYTVPALGSDPAYELKSYEIVGGQDNSSSVIMQIDNAIIQNGTLILTFHKIVVGSLNASDPSTEFLESDFVTVSNYLASKKAEVDVVTLSDYFGLPARSLLPFIPTVTYTNGSTWINSSYTLGLNTDKAIVSVNGTEVQNSSLTFYNATGIPKHVIMTISIMGLNSLTGEMSAAVSKDMQILNNPVIINWSSSSQNINGNNNSICSNNISSGICAQTKIYVGDNFTIIPIVSDADFDTINYTTTATKGIINSTTGIFTINTSSASDIGNYNWSIIASDNYGSSAVINFNLIVEKPVQTLSLAHEDIINAGVFSINWSFTPGGLESDYIVVLINGVEVQNSTKLSYNTLSSPNISVVPHGLTNISVMAHNNTFGDVWTNETSTFRNYRVCITDDCIKDFSTNTWTIWASYNVVIGTPLIIDPKTENLDNDVLFYELIQTNKSENATALNATINSSTGHIVITNMTSVGFFYNYTIQVRDNYGSSDSNNFTIYTIAPTEYKSSGWTGSNGGGGGGGADVYDPNIWLFERSYSEIRNGIESNVNFTKNKLISNVKFTGVKNYGEVKVKISLLKGNPTDHYICDLCSFFMITLDNMNSINEHLYITNNTPITFNINKSNLSDGVKVKLLKLNNDTWESIEVEDTKIETNDSKVFTANTHGFSLFTIILEPKYEPINEKTLNVVEFNTSSEIPGLLNTTSQQIEKAKQSLYRLIISLIKKYMWWI